MKLSSAQKKQTQSIHKSASVLDDYDLERRLRRQRVVCVRKIGTTGRRLYSGLFLKQHFECIKPRLASTPHCEPRSLLLSRIALAAFRCVGISGNTIQVIFDLRYIHEETVYILYCFTRYPYNGLSLGFFRPVDYS